MARTHLPTQDAASADPLRVFDDASVLWSSGPGGWSGLLVERIRVEAIDTPAFRIRPHSLTLHLSEPRTVRQTIAGKTYSSVLQPGDISLFPAGATRRLRHGRREMLVLALADELVESVAAEALGTFDPCIAERHQLRDARIEHIARALQSEAEAGYPSGPLYGESLGRALAARLVRGYATAEPSAARRTGGLSARSLRRVVEYVDAHLAEDVGMRALARVAGLSPHRFAHNFKRATGLAPHQFVIRARVRRAKLLLRESDKTIAEVAYELGCGSPSRFALLFRRTAGATPSAYRASFR
jgi:AraC family transcriptional regulator